MAASVVVVVEIVVVLVAESVAAAAAAVVVLVVVMVVVMVVMVVVVAGAHYRAELVHLWSPRNPLGNILKEVCGKKKYMGNMKIQEVRKCFKARTMMLPFAGNYAADRRYAKSGWLCRCGVREEEEHIRAGRCPLYRDIWAEYDDLQDTDNLVSFLTRVLDRREQVEELDREEKEQKEQERAELQPPVFASPLMGTSQSSDVCRLD